MFEKYLIQIFNWWHAPDERFRTTMPIKMIYDVDTSKECMFPSGPWRELMQHWPELERDTKTTLYAYPDNNTHIAKLVRNKPLVVSNIRFEVEYTFRECPFNLISRNPFRVPEDSSEFDEPNDDLSYPKMITKVFAHYGDRVVWDTERFLRYAGHKLDFHDSKDIRLRDLFEDASLVPDRWEVHTLTSFEPFFIDKDDELNRHTLEPNKT